MDDIYTTQARVEYNIRQIEQMRNQQEYQQQIIAEQQKIKELMSTGFYNGTNITTTTGTGATGTGATSTAGGGGGGGSYFQSYQELAGIPKRPPKKLKKLENMLGKLL